MVVDDAEQFGPEHVEALPDDLEVADVAAAFDDQDHPVGLRGERGSVGVGQQRGDVDQHELVPVAQASQGGAGRLGSEQSGRVVDRPPAAKFLPLLESLGDRLVYSEAVANA